VLAGAAGRRNGAGWAITPPVQRVVISVSVKATCRQVRTSIAAAVKFHARHDAEGPLLADSSSSAYR
jgi:hypothetical protein